MRFIDWNGDGCVDGRDVAIDVARGEEPVQRRGQTGGHLGCTGTAVALALPIAGFVLYLLL